MVRWHAVFTKPRMERLVAEALEGKGHETFLPLIRYHGRSGRLLSRAFFPRYIFARFEWDRDGPSIRWTRGLTSLVTFDGLPAVVPDDLVDGLRQQLELLDGDAFLMPKPGDRVKIVAGPLKDMRAVFDSRIGASGRVYVLLEILGRETRVELQDRDLDAV